ncbi:zinc ABC transporter substrate-binding protein [Wenxinia marina]|uniref:High-affinity zinc uptake system protein ZnuA n=1 Tax=Wenxinia marina DSM 24838 TaxID=1123501 RepID=A0A0D0PDV7_9RHOB|nr:zinc ABC transporter substrate-binding protein [Wenxinia marina]KIQ69611.1 ABC-type Zn2+ transport system, periplasmic component/surface adhesin [Wenxinia marina DSM 24838]GGL59738.1 zinc transporter [Wenxinia marina]
MSRNPLPLSMVTILLGGAAVADVPRVVADIAPVHALVSRVMQGVGVPDLIVQAGASPHVYNLRPSEAGALQEADLVFWTGPDLTPWLTDALDTLAADATVTALEDVDGTALLQVREGASFEAHEHGAADHAEHEHGDEDHGEGDDHAAHEDEAQDHDHDHDHGHDQHDHGHDPHAWLSPANAAVWVDEIAAQLAAADPENAAAYAANAAAAREELSALEADIDATLAPVRGRGFIVFHDAYQYFETAFDMPASGAISLSDAAEPGPARIAEIRDRVADAGIDCVLTEPQFNPGLVATVLDGTEVRTAVLDPLGSGLEPGADLYPQMMRDLATALAGCL